MNVTKIKAISISSVKNEQLSSFLSRLAEEAKTFERSGKEVQDIFLTFPNDIDADQSITADIHFLPQQADEFEDMETVILQSEPYKRSLAALSDNIELLQKWVDGNKDLELYGMKTEFIINDEGDQVSRTSIYYSSDPKDIIG